MKDCLNEMIEALLAVDPIKLPCLLVDAWFGELCFLIGQLRRADDRARWQAQTAARFGLGYPGGPEALCAYVVQRSEFESRAWATWRAKAYPVPAATMETA